VLSLEKGFTMRKTILLSAVIALLLVGVMVAVAACGGGTTTSSSTTATSSGDTTTTAVDDTATTAVDDTTSTAAGDTTTTSEETTTTTEAARTTDTSDHAADFRAQYPSSESFDNSTWATVNSNPSSHLGAAADVKGTASKVTVDPDSKYLTWQLSVNGSTVLCRTNLNVDRTLLSGGGTVEVKGIVVGAQEADAGGGAIVYVQSVSKAS
jgi:hypothetical protein